MRSTDGRPTDALPPGWRLGSPWFHDEAERWEMYAYGPALPGTGATEWTAVGPTPTSCNATMRRCLGDLKAGRWPR